MLKEELKKIPGVDRLLQDSEVKSLINEYGSSVVKYIIREHLSELRNNIKDNCPPADYDSIISEVKRKTELISAKSLKPVINATGIILNTNLGRAPLGNFVTAETERIMRGYSNLEVDLKSGKRSKRIFHVIELIKFLTGAEDAVVVNNNAAAVSLIMRVFANGMEVIVSRGELVEIGGSFRMPEIIRASGSVMIEVGTTNRTNINDYKNAITENTRLLLKVHKSNYIISGFTEETSIDSISKLAKENSLISVYDIGSGLISDKDLRFLKDEPAVRSSISSGCDLITFSCDKLLGGPQAGIIAGRKDLIEKISKDPLMRTYRVDKMILAALSSVLRLHLNEKERNEKLPVYMMLNKTEDELKCSAEKLMCSLKEYGIDSEIIRSGAACGGGTLAGYIIKSYSVKLMNYKKEKDFAQYAYSCLLNADAPVMAILKGGDIYFDVLTLSDEEIALTAEEIKRVYEKYHNGHSRAY